MCNLKQNIFIFILFQKWKEQWIWIKYIIIIIIIIPTFEKTLINKNISHKRHRERSSCQNPEIHSVLGKSSKLK